MFIIWKHSSLKNIMPFEMFLQSKTLGNDTDMDQYKVLTQWHLKLFNKQKYVTLTFYNDLAGCLLVLQFTFVGSAVSQGGIKDF